MTTIGVLKETGEERRVAITPEIAGQLVKMGAVVIVEDNAGFNAHHANSEYEEKGAKIGNLNEVMQAQVVIGVGQPTDNVLAMLNKEQVFIANLNALANKETATKLAERGVTVFSLDIIPRTTRAQAMDVLSSMATIAGYKAVLVAAGHLPKFFPMFMTAAGTVTPAKVLVLGAGVAGLQAIATARRLGAVVEAFDVRAAAKEEVLSLGAKFVDVEGAADDKSAGGYAVEQSEEFKKRQEAVVQEHAAKADVVICTAQIPGRKAPVLLRSATVTQMKPGAVVIDMAASTGGNCELTQNNQTIYQNGVCIIGDSDLAASLPTDASKMFAKNVHNFLKLIINKEGALNLNYNDDIVAGTCLCRDRQIVNERARNAYGL